MTPAARVQAAIELMEDDPLFNAGRGAVFTADGRIEHDAAIMDGTTLDAGAVAGLTRTRHPISAARAVMITTAALASAISFSAVLFVTLGAVLFLKEKVDGKTWAATIIGIIGVVIMLSPREGGDLFYVLVSIGGAIVSAGTLNVRVASRRGGAPSSLTLPVTTAVAGKRPRAAKVAAVILMKCMV